MKISSDRYALPQLPESWLEIKICIKSSLSLNSFFLLHTFWDDCASGVLLSGKKEGNVRLVQWHIFIVSRWKLLTLLNTEKCEHIQFDSEWKKWATKHLFTIVCWGRGKSTEESFFAPKQEETKASCEMETEKFFLYLSHATFGIVWRTRSFLKICTSIVLETLLRAVMVKLLKHLERFV